MAKKKRKKTSRKRKNPIDLIGAASLAASLGYDLAVARELRALRRGNRKNPASKKEVDRVLRRIDKLVEVCPAYRENPIAWGAEIATGAAFAIGSAVGGALVKPITGAIQKASKEKAKKPKGWRKNPDLLIARNPGGELEVRKKKGHRKEKLRKVHRDLSAFEGDPEFERAYESYKQFHWGSEPIEVIEVEAPEGTPKYLLSLGQAHDVTYDPPVHSRKGQGKPPFLHEFGEEGGDSPYLATDPSGEYLGYVGGTWYVTGEGIVN